MKLQDGLYLGLPTLAYGFPFLAGGSKEVMLRAAKEHSETEKRSTTTEPFAETIAGLLGSVASSVDPGDARPQPGYTFQAPGPGDSRGPCPALNLLANYGYLPRNGYVSFGEVVNATSVGFNMGTDLATVLATFAVLTDGDIATESWYLGTNAATDIGGLNRHSTIEADVSPNKEDYYLGCGDNHHISSRRFKQNVGIVANGTSKKFDYTSMSSQWAQNAKFSQTYNPYLYFNGFPAIVAVVAYNFYPEFFSNGTYELGGVANYESISSIIGAQYNASTDQFEYVPERWPANWYRRATPYLATVALNQGFTEIYPSYPLPLVFPQVGTGNFNATTILCDIYQTVNAITPLVLAGQVVEAAAGIAWALSKLDSAFAGTIAGCPVNSLSPSLYPSASRVGGPLVPPPSVLANDGNNVYYKTYFESAPTSPQCSHTF